MSVAMARRPVVLTITVDTLMFGSIFDFDFDFDFSRVRMLVVLVYSHWVHMTESLVVAGQHCPIVVKDVVSGIRVCTWATS